MTVTSKNKKAFMEEIKVTLISSRKRMTSIMLISQARSARQLSDSRKESCVKLGSRKALDNAHHTRKMLLPSSRSSAAMFNRRNIRSHLKSANLLLRRAFSIASSQSRVLLGPIILHATLSLKNSWGAALRVSQQRRLVWLRALVERKLMISGVKKVNGPSENQQSRTFSTV